MKGYGKEGSRAAAWIIAIVVGIAILVGIWKWLRSSEKPTKTSPNQTGWMLPGVDEAERAQRALERAVVSVRGRCRADA